MYAFLCKAYHSALDLLGPSAGTTAPTWKPRLLMAGVLLARRVRHPCRVLCHRYSPILRTSVNTSFVPDAGSNTGGQNPPQGMESTVGETGQKMQSVDE